MFAQYIAEDVISMDELWVDHKTYPAAATGDCHGASKDNVFFHLPTFQDSRCGPGKLSSYTVLRFYQC